MLSPLKSIGLATLALALYGCGQEPAPPAPASSEAVADAAPAPAPVPSYDIEVFMDSVRLAGASFSADGSTIAYSSNISGIFNVYAIPAGGGDSVALTDSSTDAMQVVDYFPADGRLLYSADQGGNELDHIYVRSEDGQSQDLTPGDKLKANFGGWARDNQSFYIATNERDPRYFDLYRYAVDDYQRSMVYQNDDGLTAQAISWDGRYLALVKSNTTQDSDVYLYDTEDGSKRLLTEHQGAENNTPAAFTPDGDLLLQTNRDSEFAHLVRVDLDSGERSVVFQPEWDVMYAYYSRGGKYLVAAVNADARTALHLFNAEDMSPAELPSMPAGDLNGVTFSADDSQIALYVGDSRTPRDLYRIDLGAGSVQQLVGSLNPAIDREHLVDGKVVRFTAAEEVEIPGLLYMPHAASAEAKVPALVWVHGGPGGQSRLNYSSLIQYLVNHGYAIYAINNRGSSGYGKTFFGMDDRKHGEADLADVVASKQMLIDTGRIDPERIGIIGGSYGGYMVLAAMAFEPEAFQVGVDIFGVSNWLRTLTSIPPWWESFKAALYAEMGDPATDEERLRRISPLFHADQIQRPLMVLQGANDPRVLQVESDEIVEAVKANGVPVEYVVFEDEGHGFVNRANEIQGYRAVKEFLDQHLKGEGPE